MHVLTKNLVNVSKFAQDKNAFFLKFHYDICFVKSHMSKEIFLRGWLRDGLYMFDNVYIPR